MKDKQNNNLKEAIEESDLAQSIMIWGASHKSDEIAAAFLEWGFSISGYVDKNYLNIMSYNGYDVYPIEQLREKSILFMWPCKRIMRRL